ncbi:hypothetical protein POVWA2_009570 [Plasmodium ovale wallikeri]|uniref:Uncharacterized protein n=2 Tax=Plasmodium ovale TaxID=36330 RepID=A0A1A8YLK4_PLAOA|nr:hypothetical protein POVWA1_009560 [Plasmodium ovale wallikeri]SBT32437.1 hypothetical protein POVWA2_009570 [Plasmodium ovale wallikeri]SBT72665.1 Plasmodium exported protein, unknown function [Plasmodium ovale]
MVNSKSIMSGIMKNEGYDECILSNKLITSSEKENGSYRTSKTKKSPLYMKICLFTLFIFVMHCSNDNNTFNKSSSSEGRNVEKVTSDLRSNRCLAQIFKKLSEIKESLVGEKTANEDEEESDDEEEGVSNPQVEEAGDEKAEEKHRKLAEETYKKKVEERYGHPGSSNSARRPEQRYQPPMNPNQFPPQINEQQLLQLLKHLPPPPMPMNRMPMNIPGPAGANRGGLHFENPQQMMEFLKFMNERTGNKMCSLSGNCEEEEEDDEEKTFLKKMANDIEQLIPVVLPALPPLLMMLLGTQKTYLALYTLSLAKDAYVFLQRMKK